MIFVPLPRLVSDEAPFFCPGEGGVDESLLQLQLPSGLQLFRQATQDAFQLALPHPLLEATMASLVRRIARWQVVPRRARAQDPQDAVHDGPRIGPRPAAPIRATARAEGRFEHGLLDVGEVHVVEYDGDPTDVSR